MTKKTHYDLQAAIIADLQRRVSELTAGNSPLRKFASKPLYAFCIAEALFEDTLPPPVARREPTADHAIKYNHAACSADASDEPR